MKESLRVIENVYKKDREGERNSKRERERERESDKYFLTTPWHEVLNVMNAFGDQSLTDFSVFNIQLGLEHILVS